MIKISKATLALLGLVSTKPQDELVAQLPDIDPFDFGVYSGYVPIKDTSKQIHYLLVESQQDPSTDPLIIWFNGGPGCSSMLAFMQENGPYKQDDDTGDLTVNEYSWNREASVLYIEQPAGVGFSTTSEAMDYDDAQAARDNAAFVHGFLALYKSYQSHDFYITSESYGGHYMPTLAKELAQNKGHCYLDSDCAGDGNYCMDDATKSSPYDCHSGTAFTPAFKCAPVMRLLWHGSPRVPVQGVHGGQPAHLHALPRCGARACVTHDSLAAAPSQTTACTAPLPATTCCRRYCF